MSSSTYPPRDIGIFMSWWTLRATISMSAYNS
jgi:hypothetical protein